MSLIQLAYGSGNIQLQIPERNLALHNAVDQAVQDKTNFEKISDALANPAGTGLEQLAQNKKVICLIYDASRKVPQAEFLRAVFPRLVPAQTVTVILATGTHESETPENLDIVREVQNIAEMHDLKLTEVHIHNCHTDEMSRVGVTNTLQNEIKINRKLEDADLFVVYSDMKNHYFAGYSNALKNFFPGIAAYDSIERNHALAMESKSTFGRHPLHDFQDRRDNPLAQDMLEACHLITRDRPVFVVTTVTSGESILWAAAGLLERVTPEGMSKVDRYFSCKVKPARYMIVSCGGFPNDESLYMAQRALELTRAGVIDGGEVLFIAECRKGIGPDKSIQNFYQPLIDPVDQIIKNFEKRRYIMYAHKTYKFARMINELSKINVLSKLSEKTIKNIHLYPVTSAQSIVDTWLQRDPEAIINVFPEGNKLAVYAGRL